MQPNALLQETCNVHRFDLAVLTDMDGFALAYAGTNQREMESVAATSALAWQLVQRMQEHIGLDEVEEYALSNRRGQKLVCRLFEVNTQRMMVVFLLPVGIPHRRAATRLVRRLQQLLETPKLLKSSVR